ncbi:MAG: hypothetical protein AAF541_08310 [Pseudomonadota bacterium]
MHELIGRTFNLENIHYSVVDVRSLGGDVMIYALPQVTGNQTQNPQKAAFRFADIEPLIEPVAHAG